MIGMTRANAVNTFGNLRFHWPEYLMEAGELGCTCSLRAQSQPCYNILLHRSDMLSLTASFAEPLWD